MVVRRQPTQRLLSGRNAANPIEMASDFNLSSSSPQSVGGVMRAVKPQGGIDDGPLAVLNGLAEWGTKKVREAAKTRYETLAMDGAMAYQQGKSVDELPMDGNKWMLEGYRVMEAETVASALYAAQQEEISLRLHESDPDTFRANYVGRLNAALAGKDERTQEIIKQRMAEQMPSLVAQHTRENARYQEGQNYDALTSSIDVISRDPANTNKLVDFALGGAGSEGLSSERRQSAVIDGVVRAYANGNPLAYSVLEGQGIFDNLTAEEAGKLDAAQRAYESKVRSTYDETRFNEERALMDTIALGELTPEEAVAAWAEFTTRHGLTMGADEAGAVANAAAGSNATHTKAVNLEIETAKINGDYAKVADLSFQYADRAARPGTPGTIYDHGTTIEYQMGPKRPNKPSEEIQSVIGRAVQDVFGEGAKVVITSGTEDEGHQHGSNRHKTGNAADFAVYRPDGTRVKVTEEEANAFAVRAAELGVSGIGYGEEYMGDSFHFDLVGTKGGGGNVWASGAKANGENIIAAINSAGKAPDMGPVDPEKWKTLVDYYKGDLELAAVAYSTSTAHADEWNDSGRLDSGLSPDTQSFVSRFTGGMTGKRYVTAETRAGLAEEAYRVAKEAAAVDVYARIQPELAGLADQFKNGVIDQGTYDSKTAALRAEWGLAQTKADVDQTIALGRMRQEALQAQMVADAQVPEVSTERLADPTWVQERKDEDYAKRLGSFSVERENADNMLTDAIESITSAVKPDGVTDEAFLKSQQDAILAAQSVHQQEIAASALAYGIEWKDSAAVETAKKGIDKVRGGLDKALQNTKDNAIMERAVATGTLGSQPKNIQDRAYEKALADIDTSTQRYATTPKKDGSMPGAEEVALFQQNAMEDWFAKSNFVPEQVRNEFSAVVTGQLVTKDGVVDQHALDAITAYATLKQKSSVAAEKLLDPQARVIAEAALNTAGTPEGLPRVLLDMWAQGLNSPFTGKPSPDFLERSDVQNHIKTALGSNGLINAIMGNDTPIETMRLDGQGETMVRSMMEAQIKSLHALNPNLNPKYVTKMAEDAVLKSAVPIMQQGYGLLGGRPGESLYGLFEGENSLLIDPTGGNIYEQMFGAQAPQFEADRSVVSSAITGYLASDEFKGKYGDMTPTIGAFEWMYEALPFTNNDVRKSAKYGTPIFTAQHVGNGKIYLDFTLDKDGTTASIVLPLEEAGAWYKKSVQNELTK